MSRQLEACLGRHSYDRIHISIETTAHDRGGDNGITSGYQVCWFALAWVGMAVSRLAERRRARRAALNPMKRNWGPLSGLPAEEPERDRAQRLDADAEGVFVDREARVVVGERPVPAGTDKEKASWRDVQIRGEILARHQRRPVDEAGARDLAHERRQSLVVDDARVTLARCAAVTPANTRSIASRVCCRSSSS